MVVRATNSEVNVRLIGAACSTGAGDRGCALGPAVIARSKLPRTLKDTGIALIPDATIEEDSGSGLDVFGRVRSFSERLAPAVAQRVASREKFVVIGGDHSCALGTWRGVASATGDGQRPGLLWIDAHLDAHVPQSSPSGLVHGMPVACLLGHGADELTAGGAVIDPQNLVIVGARSFEAEEHDLLVRLGVRIHSMEEIGRKGLEAVLQSALRKLSVGSTAWGLSLDLDALDPLDAPGVTTPAPHGLNLHELTGALHRICAESPPVGLEIAEFNPLYDRDELTVSSVAALVTAVFRAGPRPALQHIERERRFGAHNYDPLPVVITRGEGVHLWDTEGHRYVDMMSGYSSVSHGHCHPRLLRTMQQQASRLCMTSRAFHSDRLGRFLEIVCERTGQEAALPMNTGAEAVETALKAVRKWACQVKGIVPGYAEIIVCDGNFHGRTIAIVGMSTEAQYRAGFGPFAPGFVSIPFGDSAALERAITERTAAFLVEPMQGEGGMNIPPDGYLAKCAEICRRNDVLLVCDEVQTGLGRTGRFLACDHEKVVPDGLILGKALGGGLVPVSMFLARREVIDVFQPGDHGSTFGGNPLAAAVGLEALEILEDERLAERSARMGRHLVKRLREFESPGFPVLDVRGRGLFVGIELDPARCSGAGVCNEWMRRGVLSKESHRQVLRLTPPLVINREQLDWAAERLHQVLSEIRLPVRPDKEEQGLA